MNGLVTSSLSKNSLTCFGLSSLETDSSREEFKLIQMFALVTPTSYFPITLE